MPRYYVDLDNNRLLTGPSTTQLAATPRLVQGDKPVLDVDLLTRKDGVLSYYTSTASAIHVRVGTLGGTAVASALTLSTVTISATATATAGLTAPVTATGIVSMLGSVTATATAGLGTSLSGAVCIGFDQVQMPGVVAIVSDSSVSALEVVTCGKNFSALPEVSVSYPDVLRPVFLRDFIEGPGSKQIFSTNADASSPEVLQLVINYDASIMADQVYSLRLVSGSSETTITTNVVSTAGTGLVGTYVTTAPGLLTGNVSLHFVQLSTLGGATSFVLYTAEWVKVSQASRATLTSSLNQSVLQLGVNSGGSYYSDAPDVIVVPSERDYALGAVVTPTGATASGRRVTVSKNSHGLTTNSYILVENMNVDSAKIKFPLGGIWRVTSASANDFEFRVANFVCVPSVSTSVSVGGARIYPLEFRRMASSATVVCSGAGYAPGSVIPFSVDSDSCGGSAASGVVTVANSGQLSGAAVVSRGSGFSSATTVVTLTAYQSLSGLTVTCAGSGYWTTAPTVTLSNASLVATAPGSAPAVVRSRLLGNGQIALDVVSAGYGYTSAPAITIDPPNFGDGIRVVTVGTRGVGYSDGTYACTVSAAPAGGTDAVVNFVKTSTSQSFVVVNPGRGYTSTPLVTPPAPDLAGQVSGFTVTCAGAGYVSTPRVTFIGGGGSGAAATAVVANGTVTSIILAASGSGYTSAPSVALDAPETSVYYSKQIDLSVAGVTTLLAGGSSASAVLQVEEKLGADTSVLAQLPVTVVARVG